MSRPNGEFDQDIERILNYTNTILPLEERTGVRTVSIGGVQLVQGIYRTDQGDNVSVNLGIVKKENEPFTMFSLTPLEIPIPPPTVANTYAVPIEELRDLPFGGIVRRLRLAADITQQTLAERGQIDSGYTLVSRVERGHIIPARKGALRLIKGLGLNEEEPAAQLLMSKAFSKAGRPTRR